MNKLLGDRRSAALLLAAVLLLLTSTHAVLLAQNLGAAPQTNFTPWFRNRMTPKVASTWSRWSRS